MKRLVRIGGGLVVACGLGVSSVAAHHSATMFDHSKTMTIKGTVVELRWTNPHVSLLVNGAPKDGEEPTLNPEIVWKCK